jgi:plasmid stability protein
MSVNLSIKGVAEPVAERLRQRARRNHRSLQGELMAIIEQAVESSIERASQRGAKTIEDLVAERRLRPLQQPPGLPLAVDIIRADRDNR